MNRNKKKRPLLGLLVLMMCWQALPAQETAPMAVSLEAARQYALSHNKTIQASKMDIDIARKKVTETTAIGLPQLNFEANYQHVFKVPEFAFPQTGMGKEALFPSGGAPAGYSEYSLGNGLYGYSLTGPGMPIMEQDNATFDFQVSQLIFSGEYIVGLQAAKVFKTISEQMLKKNELDVLLSVESTYYMALVLSENLDILKQNVELTRKTVDEMKAMLGAGFVEDTEVDQLGLTLIGLQNLEVSMTGQLKNVYNLLKYQMGMDLAQPITLSDNIEMAVAAVPALLTAEFDVNGNIDYQMVSNQVAVQKLNLRRQQSTFLPTLAAFYQHQEKLKQPVLDFTPKDLLGVSLSLPIFTSTQRLMRVKQASIELDKSRLSQSQVAEGLRLQYESQKLAYETAYNNYLNQKQNKEVSKRIFDKTVVKLKEGVASSLELTQVQAQYLSAIGSYFNSMQGLLNARAEMNRLTSTK